MFCVVIAVSLVIVAPRSAYSQTADCQAEAESISGLRGGSIAPGVYPGSTPGTGQPGASNTGSNDSGRIWAEVYADCVRRQALNRPQPRTGTSEPTPFSPGARDRQR